MEIALVNDGKPRQLGDVAAQTLLTTRTSPPLYIELKPATTRHNTV